MSPEQARGEGVDYRTDIYSLGVIVYEMLTHTIPHDAPTSVGILMKRMTQPPPSPRVINPAISASVEQVILRSLSVIPSVRYEQAMDNPAPLVVVVTATATNTPTSTPDVPTASPTATPSLPLVCPPARLPS
jgi:eukaryotic-like serine/threonine-protein kinase